MKKSRLILGLASMMLCGVLVGCTGNNVNDKVADNEADSVAEAVSENMAQESDSQDVAASENAALESESDLEGKTTITYIGHATVKIVTNDGTIIYIDPNYSEWDYSSEPADYVFITHSHGDHQPDYNFKMKDTAVMITQKEALQAGVYMNEDFGDIHVEAVPASNENHDIKYCVGYLITVDGITIYHAGDTSMIEQMSELADKDIDYAFYPIDGEYNMDAVEATEVANLVGAKYNIPIHELDNHEFDPTVERKSNNFTPEGAMVLEYGETIVVGE